MSHFKFSINFKNSQKINIEIVSAILFDLGFDSCEEVGNILYAYLEKIKVNDKLVSNVQKLALKHNFNFEYSEFKNENWNEIWESNFDPIFISEHCYIRASFHKKSNCKYDIIIDPKMSFGTGHHETTFLVCNELLNTELDQKKVLDFGCGTAILSILASKLNAKKVTAVDYDLNCISNSTENLKKNNIDNVELINGDKVPLNKKYDLIISNINRNIIIQSFESFHKTEAKELILSGFLISDYDLLAQTYKKYNFKLVNKKYRNQWLMLKLEK